jgi:hypothetical protein
MVASQMREERKCQNSEEDLARRSLVRVCLWKGPISIGASSGRCRSHSGTGSNGWSWHLTTSHQRISIFLKQPRERFLGEHRCMERVVRSQTTSQLCSPLRGRSRCKRNTCPISAQSWKKSLRSGLQQIHRCSKRPCLEDVKKEFRLRDKQRF